MIMMSKKGGAEVHHTVLVAYDPATGAVHGTYVHTAFSKTDDASPERERVQFAADVTRQKRLTAPPEIVIATADEIARGIEHVDVVTRRLVVKGSSAAHRR